MKFRTRTFVELTPNEQEAVELVGDLLHEIYFKHDNKSTSDTALGLQIQLIDFFNDLQDNED